MPRGSLGANTLPQWEREMSDTPAAVDIDTDTAQGVAPGPERKDSAGDASPEAQIDAQVKVVEPRSGEVLLQCGVEEEARAYQFAQEMEQMGVEVKIIAPSVSQTLASGLGVSAKDWQGYQRSMDQEIADHDGSQQNNSK